MNAVTPVSVDVADTFKAGQLLRDEVNRAVRAGATLDRIARSANLNARTVSKLWHGETKFPRYGTITALLKHFGYKLEARR